MKKSYFKLVRKSINKVIFPVLGFALLLSPTTGVTRQWYAKPSASLTTAYDTNLRMRAEDRAKQTFGVNATLASDFGVIADRYEAKFNARFKSNHYQGDDLDSNDFYLNLKSQFKLTEKHNINFDAQYINDTSLTSEEFTSGFVQGNTPRQMYSITPSGTYQFSETQYIQTNYNHSETSYEKQQNLNLLDYQSDSLDFAYSQQWNEVARAYVSLNALDYKVPEINRETRDYSITGGIDYTFSETWTGNFSVGGRRTETIIKAAGQKFTDVGYGPLFSFGTKKQFERGSINANFSQSLSPTGSGEFLQNINLSLSTEYRLTERFKAHFSAQMTDTSSSIADVRSRDRVYYTVEPRLSWQLNRQTDISGSYRYRYRKYDFSETTAVSNAVFLTINYRWDKFSSRRF